MMYVLFFEKLDDLRIFENAALNKATATWFVGNGYKSDNETFDVSLHIRPRTAKDRDRILRDYERFGAGGRKIKEPVGK